MANSTILEVLLNAQHNFNSMYVMVGTNPLYRIAKGQLDNALMAISKGKGLDDNWEEEPTEAGDVK